jgi:hypothetical protein
MMKLRNLQVIYARANYYLFFLFQLGQLLAQGVVRISGGHQKTFFIRTIYFKFPPLDVAEILKRGR